MECIIHLYATRGIQQAISNLDGVFSFVIIDAEKKEVHVGRDPYGVRPGFVLRTSNNILGICSEAKGEFEIPTKKVTLIALMPLRKSELAVK